MTRYFLHVLPALWPHILLILAVTIAARRGTTFLGATAKGGIAGVAAAAAYLLLQNGIAPPAGAPLGQFAAMLVAGGVPFIGTAWVTTLVARLKPGMPAGTAGLLVGLILLVPMPTIQVAVGCAMTGICP